MRNKSFTRQLKEEIITEATAENKNRELTNFDAERKRLELKIKTFKIDLKKEEMEHRGVLQDEVEEMKKERRKILDNEDLLDTDESTKTGVVVIGFEITSGEEDAKESVTMEINKKSFVY